MIATPEDLARDLAADMALIEACKPDRADDPGLHVMDWKNSHGVFSDDNDLLAAVESNLAMGLWSYSYARLFAECYRGWPAAIRLAKHWQAEAERLQHDLTIAQSEIDRLAEDRLRIRTDAAVLRNALWRAAETYHQAMAGKPRREWAEEPAAVWQSLYEAVRDATAGLGLLAELERLRARVAELEGRWSCSTAP
jgi:hypothetical protein